MTSYDDLGVDCPFAGTIEQVRAWNAARRARIASQRRARNRVTLNAASSGIFRVGIEQRGPGNPTRFEDRAEA